MKKNLIVLSLMIIPLLSVSQKKEKENRKHEVGLFINPTNLSKSFLQNPFVGYKWQSLKKENKYFRLGVSGLGSEYSEYIGTENVSNYLSGSFGIEKRKSISSKTALINGWGVSTAVGFSKRINSVNSSSSSFYNLGFHKTLGVNYYISEHFLVNLEYTPGVNFKYGLNGDSFGYNLDFSFNRVRLGVMLRF